MPHGVPPGGTFWCELAPAVGLPVPQRSFFAKTVDSCGASCAAEAYCFCSPCYALSLVFIPLTLTLQLVIAALGATSDA